MTSLKVGQMPDCLLNCIQWNLSGKGAVPPSWRSLGVKACKSKELGPFEHFSFSLNHYLPGPHPSSTKSYHCKVNLIAIVAIDSMKGSDHVILIDSVLCRVLFSVYHNHYC